MNLKKRFLVSNLSVILIPIIITAVFSFIYILIASYFYDTDISIDNITMYSNVKYKFHTQIKKIELKNLFVILKNISTFAVAFLVKIKGGITY